MVLQKFQIPKPERDAEVVRLVKTGLSYSEVGKRFDISKQRVAIIYKRTK